MRVEAKPRTAVANRARERRRVERPQLHAADVAHNLAADHHGGALARRPVPADLHCQCWLLGRQLPRRHLGVLLLPR